MKPCTCSVRSCCCYLYWWVSRYGPSSWPTRSTPWLSRCTSMLLTWDIDVRTVHYLVDGWLAVRMERWPLALKRGAWMYLCCADGVLSDLFTTPHLRHPSGGLEPVDRVFSNLVNYVLRMTFTAVSSQVGFNEGYDVPCVAPCSTNSLVHDPW